MNIENSSPENLPRYRENNSKGPHRVAIKMKLKKGYEKEYRRRHDSLWPDLRDLLHSKGISDYGIYLEQESGNLFGVLKVENLTALDELPYDPLMKQWWNHMKDIMETNQDNSPVSIPLTEVFYLP